MSEEKLFPDARLYPACEIYSHPEVKARDGVEADPDKGITARPARRAHPPRRGILPIGKTQFERLRKAQGKFPEPDAELNGRPHWTGRLLNAHLLKPAAKQ